MAGITPEGFVAPTQLEILAGIEAEQLSQISSDLDVTSDSALGQVNGIISQRLAQLWELLAVAYGAFDRDSAEGSELTTIGKLTGTVRRGASYSIVGARVHCDSGTALEAGTHFAHVAGKPDNRFTPLETFTATITGYADVAFRSEEAGPFYAAANSLTVIATPVVGWNSITNPQLATAGRPPDDDATLRRRIDDKIAQSGGSTLDAIVADVLQVNAVEAADGFENTTDGVYFGMPALSFEILIFDGDPGVADNDEIAQAIWDGKPAGMRAFGSTVGTARDTRGVAHPVYFSRAAVAEIWIEFELTTTTGYPGAAAVKDFVAEACSKRFGVTPGADVLALFVRALPLNIEGVIDVPGFTIGTGPGPALALNIDINSRTIARFDPSRITVTP